MFFIRWYHNLIILTLSKALLKSKNKAMAHLPFFLASLVTFLRAYMAWAHELFARNPNWRLFRRMFLFKSTLYYTLQDRREGDSEIVIVLYYRLDGSYIHVVGEEIRAISSGSIFNNSLLTLFFPCFFFPLLSLFKILTTISLFTWHLTFLLFMNQIFSQLWALIAKKLKAQLRVFV